MTKIYMMTIPKSQRTRLIDGTKVLTSVKICKKELKIMLDVNDCKKWIIASEIGKGGYEHWQIRIETSNKNFFNWVKEQIPEAHVEEASDTWTYEKKDGQYISSEDTPEVRAVRFGKPNGLQSQIIKKLQSQDVRSIDAYVDKIGNVGKSWLTIHLWEKGKALIVPRSASTSEKLSAFICSSWKGEPIIIIDIPRARKITEELYETMEEIKDGLVFDHRYQGRARNLRGVKLLVFSNKYLNLKKLSEDRWRLHKIVDGKIIEVKTEDKTKDEEPLT